MKNFLSISLLLLISTITLSAADQQEKAKASYEKFKNSLLKKSTDGKYSFTSENATSEIDMNTMRYVGPVSQCPSGACYMGLKTGNFVVCSARAKILPFNSPIQIDLIFNSDTLEIDSHIVHLLYQKNS